MPRKTDQAAKERPVVRALPSVARARELLRYSDGDLYWRIASRCTRIGKKAGCLARSGYVLIRIDGTLYRAHRLVWLILHGQAPTADVDHKDRNRANNRIRNLREATVGQNSANMAVTARCKSGRKGVCWIERLGKWKASMTLKGKSIHLGMFESIDDAAAAYELAATLAHGEFARV